MSERAITKEEGLVIFVFILTEVDRDDWKEFPIVCSGVRALGSRVIEKPIQVGHNFSTFMACRTSTDPARASLNVSSPWKPSLIYSLFHCHYCNDPVPYVYTFLMVFILQ